MSLLAFVPDGGTLFAYSVACLILFITPGPDMSLFLAKTLADGRKAGIAAMLGANVGCCVHTLLAALGLSALIAASATAFSVMKVIGALYLGWLAIDAIRNGSALSMRPEQRAPASFWRTFVVGIGINLTNPKVVLFFVTFLPQFIDPHDPHAAGKLVFQGFYFVLFNAPLSAVFVIAAGRIVTLLRARPRILRAIDYVFAGVFGLFAVRIALTSR